MDEEDHIRIVREGYDKIAHLYHAERDTFDISRILEDFMSSVTPGGHILDAGCGAGVPVASALVDSGFQVTGIDISESMLKLARKHVPAATFLLQDMTKLQFDPETFDGIISTYAVIHVPKALHAEVFRRFYITLKPNGRLLVSLSQNEWENIGEYFREPMFWSHHDQDTSLEIIEDAGFRIIWSRVIQIRDEHPFWVMAEK
ncbi:MAG: class I SAM-dependent methyltransferase [Candidatus Thorarchaeota archaeon]|nr:MAG: class I SAM-dependent methyltransferase [Candidatus Thorarchaeota archaeon]